MNGSTSPELAPITARSLARAVRDRGMSEEEWRAEIVGTSPEFAALVSELVPEFVERPPSVDQLWVMVAQINAGLSD